MTVQPIQPQDRMPKKVTGGSKRRKQQAMDSDAFGIRIDGEDYVLNPNDMTGAAEFRIRKEIGMGISELSQRLQTSPGADYLGMFMWAVRVAHGEHDLELMEVLENVSMGSDVEVIEEPDTGPKASDSAS